MHKGSKKALFIDKPSNLYAHGDPPSPRHLTELYEIAVSAEPDLPGHGCCPSANARYRPLDPCLSDCFSRCLAGENRDEGLDKNKAVYVALAFNADGEKEVLDLWIEQTEGAKFWLKIINDLKARGVNDILIAVVDGLKGFPEAITAVFPQTQVSMRAMDQAERECSNEDDDLQREICIVLVFTHRPFKEIIGHRGMAQRTLPLLFSTYPAS